MIYDFSQKFIYFVFIISFEMNFGFPCQFEENSVIFNLKALFF